MQFMFIGHVSRDIDTVTGIRKEALGGGVFHNAITAARLGEPTRVLTRAAPAEADRARQVFADAGIEAVVLDGETSTSIENTYRNHCPDSRVSRLISRATPFSAADLDAVGGDVVLVNPLWFPEFPPELLEELRDRARTLAIDAQGFLRRPGEDGTLGLVDWPEKRQWLPLVDVLKVDTNEAKVLTGLEDAPAAAAMLGGMGPRQVLLTHAAGGGLWDGADWVEFSFGPYALQARTGRGDTFTSAYLVASSRRMSGPDAVRFAADVTTRKLQYAGPFRG
jgi:sugar/nucleoside kinase (ribokinase family)